MTLSVRTIPSILSSKIHVNWFYKLNENSITDSNQEPIGSCPNLNKILFFSASLSTLKAIQYELNKNSPLSRRNFRELNSLKILRSYSVSSKCSLSFAVRKMYLHLRRFNISNNKKIHIHSTKLEKAGIVTSLLNIATRVTYEKYVIRFPDVVVVLILQML